MLLQFSVSNYLSFADENEIVLSMVPAKSKTMRDHIMSDALGKKISVLPLAVIYGANASGKTNLVNAIDFARNIVLRGVPMDQSTGVKPFLLNTETEHAPSRFEFVFKHLGVVYTYGFVLSSSHIHEEWLFAHYTNQESKVFERLTVENRTKLEAGARLISDAGGAQYLDFVAKGTRPNQLFLTEANEKNISLLKPVMSWFRDHLAIIRPDSEYFSLASRVMKDKDFITYLSEFLRVADTGIGDIRCNKEVFDPEKHLHGIPKKIIDRMLEEMKSRKAGEIVVQSSASTITISLDKNGEPACLRLKMEHRKQGGESVYFDTKDESDGTRRLMNLAPLLLDVWERNRVFIIDELDRSLHTLLSRLFIQSVLAGVAKKKAQGQFIMTTHDTNLLDRSLLRSDEIWFMEKDPAGASHLTSLAEYKLSEGLNIEKGYLNGRFGAIPFVGDLQRLMV